MKVKKLCYWCREKPAKKLPELHGNYATGVYFCSLRCAAYHGMERVLAESPEWCDRHGQWYFEPTIQQTMEGCHVCRDELNESLTQESQRQC